MKRIWLFAITAAVTAWVGCAIDKQQPAPGDGGSTATGGVTSATGSANAMGGINTTGGAGATGGRLSTGGSSATGGGSAAGGGPTTGGLVATGGSPATGGLLATGGNPAASGTGGMTSGGGNAGGSYVGSGGASGGANSGGATARAGSGGSTTPAVDLWYEAEAIVNTVDNGANIQKTSPTCTTVVVGASCYSGGAEVKNLLGRGGTNNAGGGVTFVGVTVPTAGVYDVTWWYHCGSYDNWHDNNCGGGPYPTWMSWYNPNANPQPGCRPHLIAVNGTQVDGADHSTPFWQFPCFGGSWDVIRAATTPLTLAAGKNNIRIGGPHIADLDGADIDAMHVSAEDAGTAPRILAPFAIAGDDNRK